MQNVRKLAKAFILLLICSLIFTNGALAMVEGIGISPETEEENKGRLREVYQIRLINELDGKIEISLNQGATWQSIGRVVKPANKVNPKGYTASAWAKNGTVAAIAVNALHIKVNLNPKDDKGVIFSILPKEQLEVLPKDYSSYLSPSSSIFTDIPAGSSIFGGGFSPFVGNPVYVELKGKLTPIAQDYVPKEGDIIIIKVEKPVRYPARIIFENRFGGFITLIYPDGEEKKIGEVFKPVQGTGNFLGSLYTRWGRIRANHCGVICISTSPQGKVGGFQIIPAYHGMSPEMGNARILTQWLVVGPLGGYDPSPEGTAPLFSNFIQPSFNAEDIYERDFHLWLKRLLGRSLVQVKIKNGKWQSMPRLIGRDDTSLKDVTQIQIWLPQELPNCWKD